MRFLLMLLSLALLPNLASAGVVADMKARLDARPQLREWSANYGTAGILIFSARDTRSYRAPFKGKVMALALTGSGDTVGCVLKKNGTTMCSFWGVYDGTCLTLWGCVSGTACN